MLSEARLELESVRKEVELFQNKKEIVAKHLRKYLHSQLELLNLVAPQIESDTSETKTPTAGKTSETPATVTSRKTEKDIDTGMRQALDDLEKIATVATGLFKKSELENMMNEENRKSSKRMIDDIYAELQTGSEDAEEPGKSSDQAEEL